MNTEPGARGVAVITGGSRGIGSATAIAAAHAGWSVLITYRHDEQAAVKVAETIQTAGSLASFIRADMAIEDDIAAIFDAADELGAEVAAAIVWLLGDDASYCTGSILDIAGGR